MKLGEKIAQRMKALNLNQVNLAKRSGLSQQAISQYVLDRAKPGYDGIVALSVGLEVKPQWLFEDVEG